MKKLDINRAAKEFQIIGPETYLFYNVETGEFEFYTDYMNIDEAETEKFEGDEWVAAPRQMDIGEYNIMTDFALSVPDAQKSELLRAALRGRGAFRRFKDTLDIVDLLEEWFTFKHNAFIGIAKEWCEDNDIEYYYKQEPVEEKPPQTPVKIKIKPLVATAAAIPIPGKTATVSTTVTESNTARAVGSGSLDVFATPMMIALMERAACACLSDCLEAGQTSVGTSIAIEHTKSSPVGAAINATATIEYVSGRKIGFLVTANDNGGEIGKGKHERVIVDAERFMKKTKVTKTQ